MKKRIKLILFFVFLIIICNQSFIYGQRNQTKVKSVTAIMDDFINKIKSFGYVPNLLPPTIILDNPPSFGNYTGPSRNVLELSDWTTMSKEKKDFLNAQAKQAGNGDTGESFFEKRVNDWLMIHELGHWWTMGQNQKHNHYEEEMAANRIAAAYWRITDSTILYMTFMESKRASANMPNQVPPGEEKIKYFNENYENLQRSPTYIWFQWMMIVDVYNESPKPTFKEVIKNTGGIK